jgi:hypothetical protein
VDNGPTAEVVALAALHPVPSTAERVRPMVEPRISAERLSDALITVGDVPAGYVPDPGAQSTIAIFSGDRDGGLTQTLVEAHFARTEAAQILEENIRSHGTVEAAKASFDKASSAAHAFVSFTTGENPAISVTSMPMQNYGDETFALRLHATGDLAAVASHVRIGCIQVTVLMAGGVVDSRVLMTTTHRAVEKAKGIRQ